MTRWYLTDFLKEAQEQYQREPNAVLGTVIFKIQEALLWLNEMDDRYYTEYKDE